MKDKKKHKVENEAENVQNQPKETTENQQAENAENAGNEASASDETSTRVAELEEALLTKTDQLLRLQAEFDNYRKRTLKEKMDLTKSAGENILVNILPLIDDFERALAAMENTEDIVAVRDGVVLIHKRFSDFLAQNSVKEMEALNTNFDTDQHEALTKIPAPNEEQKGKVVDVIQKGYTLNDKVIRFAKVVIGE
jgi:molecular chaperone GrpE